mmetsp:Transcript_35749/g.76324  ORF Transcript_35749/g.76324 Transcript_35749/m.76324 type:complete len:211 (+) Transcript_35749:255-887(+)
MADSLWAALAFAKVDQYSRLRRRVQRPLRDRIVRPAVPPTDGEVLAATLEHAAIGIYRHHLEGLGVEHQADGGGTRGNERGQRADWQRRDDARAKGSGEGEETRAAGDTRGQSIIWIKRHARLARRRCGCHTERGGRRPRRHRPLRVPRAAVDQRDVTDVRDPSVKLPVYAPVGDERVAHDQALRRGVVRRREDHQTAAAGPSVCVYSVA